MNSAARSLRQQKARGGSCEERARGEPRGCGMERQAAWRTSMPHARVCGAVCCLCVQLRAGAASACGLAWHPMHCPPSQRAAALLVCTAPRHATQRAHEHDAGPGCGGAPCMHNAARACTQPCPRDEHAAAWRGAIMPRACVGCGCAAWLAACGRPRARARMRMEAPCMRAWPPRPSPAPPTCTASRMGLSRRSPAPCLPASCAWPRSCP